MPYSKWFIWGPVLTLFICLGTLLLAQRITFASVTRPSLASRVPLGSVPPLVTHSQAIGHLDPQRSLSLSINLSLNHVTELQQYISELYTPGSYLYHHYLRPAEFAAQYGPSAQDIQQVSDYLRAHGFSITHASPGQQVIDFSGSVAQVEQAFGIQINTYRAADGRTFFANSTAPSVPSALRPLIQNINGLSNAVVRRHTPLKVQPLAVGRASGADTSAVATINRALRAGKSDAASQSIQCPGPGSSAAHYYTPVQFATAYNFTGFYNAGYHGEGQNIALFELDSYTPGDISAYQTCFDPNAPTRIATTRIDGGPPSQSTGGLEVEQDMEIVLGMLPGLTNLSVYEAPNTDTGYNDEWMRILTDDIPVVSTAWGTCELNLSATDISAEQQFFMQAAAQGQSLLAASGDAGAYDCGDSTTLAVDDPASNPYMTGVGGTTLAINSNNTYKSESGWSNSPAPGYGSGGGLSQLWSMPSYQSGPGVINGQSSGSPCHAAAGQYCREVPDVSFDADPNTGYVVYCTIVAASCQSSNPFARVGLTSAAALMWAVVTALSDQYALAHGGYNLGFLNPTLYTLLNSNTLYGRAFQDIKSGSNLYYSASTGYDMVTGIGTSNAYSFAQAAVALPGPRTVPANTHWYFAEGHVGNNFQEYLTLENPSVSTTADVTVNYLLKGKPALNVSLTVSPSVRTTINVNSVLGVIYTSKAGQDVSLLVTSDIPIVAERPIYFTFLGTTSGGSDVFGTNSPTQHFTFANGESQTGYYTFISVLNPSGQSQATVVAAYYSGGTMIGQSTITVPSGQRNTIFVNHDVPAGKQFLIQVDSSQPVVVERPLYFHTSVPGINGTVAGGSSVQGVSPATTWYFPSGSTGAQGISSQENLILANPDANGTGTAASVNITYALANGTTKLVSVSVPTKGQVIENVNTDLNGMAGTIVAMKVLSTNNIGIVAERQQFFSAPTLTPTPTGFEVVGVTPGSQGLPTVYSFAEGHLGNSFSEYITLFNPDSSAITVSVTYFLTRGTSRYLSQQQLNIPAMGVAQISANNFLNIPANAPGGISADAALVIQSLPGNGGTVLPVVAERTLYFNFLGSMAGSTSIGGYGGM